jgi:hypothetical protein
VILNVQILALAVLQVIRRKQKAYLQRGNGWE